MHLKLPSLFKNTILSDNHEAAAVVKEMMDENDVTVTQDMLDLAEERKVTKILAMIRPGSYDIDIDLYVESLKTHINKCVLDKMPKSKEFEFDSTKSTQLLKIDQSYKSLLESFKIQEIHYKTKCDRGCRQKDKCEIARKACQVAEYIVEELRTADRLFNFVESPFVVGSTKENSKIFSMGRFNVV